MKKITICTLLVFVSLLLLSVNSFANEVSNIGDVSHIIGEAELKRGNIDLWTKIKKHEPIKVNDMLRTGNSTKVTVKYADGAILKIKSNTQVEFKLNGLRMRFGKTWYKIVKKGSGFEVQTPTMLAGIRGTVFDVDVDYTGKSRLRVMEGTVAVTGQENTVFVKAGTYTEVLKNSMPMKPKPFKVSDASKEWGFNKLPLIPFMFKPLKKELKSVDVTAPANVADVIDTEEYEMDYDEAEKEYKEADNKLLEANIKYGSNPNHPELLKAEKRYNSANKIWKSLQK
ncbi:FecR domain-containing protein [bacterium]|nr:FecR domain-containing protein [bacterium]